MYWRIGKRINDDVVGNQRAEYGKQIVASVLRQLQKEYGAKGFDENISRNFTDMKLMRDRVVNKTYCETIT